MMELRGVDNGEGGRDGREGGHPVYVGGGGGGGHRPLSGVGGPPTMGMGGPSPRIGDSDAFGPLGLGGPQEGPAPKPVILSIYVSLLLPLLLLLLCIRDKIFLIFK